MGYSPWGHKESDMTEQASKFQLLADQVDPFEPPFHALFGRATLPLGFRQDTYGDLAECMK